MPYDINDNGAVVGADMSRGYLYSNGAITHPAPLNEADGINSCGQIAGSTSTGRYGVGRAFICSSGVMTDLGTLPGGQSGWATDIKDNGQVVGNARALVGRIEYDHAFLYSGGVMHDLETLAGPSEFSYATGINNSGQVVGHSTVPSGDAHGFLCSGGVMRDLLTLRKVKQHLSIFQADWQAGLFEKAA
jgi:probable HAF family extracellular repeat protein